MKSGGCLSYSLAGSGVQSKDKRDSKEQQQQVPEIFEVG